MSNPIYEYKGEQIEFRPDLGEWTWGGHHNVDFTKVKAAIDREMPKRWQPVEAYDFGYTFDQDGQVHRVSVAAPSADGNFWFSPKGNKRREKSYRALYEVSAHNDALIERLRELQSQSKAINEQMNQIYRSELRKLTPAHFKNGVERSTTEPEQREGEG